MKAVLFHEYGGPEVLRLEEVPTPAPGPGEALVRVRACGVNHVDLDIRAGTSRFPLKLPHIPGREPAGEVVALGPGVKDPPLGTRVMVVTSLSCGRCTECQHGYDNLCSVRVLEGFSNPAGGYSEYLVSPVEGLLPLPDSLSFEQAAAIQVVFVTAWHMLVNRAALRPGETALIQAASSGVGSAAIQVARFAGARVIATGSTEAKLAAARDLGAHETINYAQEDFVARVRQLTGGRGVDVVLEHVGGEVFTRSLSCLAIRGRLVTCGAHAGEVPPIDIIELFRKELTVIGSRRGTRLELEQVVKLVGEGAFRAVIDEVLPLAQASEAHRRLDDRRHFGKLVLVP